MLRAVRSALPMILALLAMGCGKQGDGPLHIALIGDDSALKASGARLGPAAQVIRAATVEGLVGFDAEGRVVPALADRWIVTDGGQAYIFRLRDGTWPDGSSITAQTAAAALRRAIAGLRGTALGLDLAPVDGIRVMADRVIEIDVSAPLPDLLTLLAQPELGLVHARRGSGPMAVRPEDDRAVLSLIPPEKRGLPAQEGFAARARTLNVGFVTAEQALKQFNDGDVDVLLGGRIDSLPLAGADGLSRGNVQLDPVIGLFGLMVENGSGFLANPANREALSMAIDRDALIAAFNIRGWQPTTRIVSPDVEDDLGTVGERWTGIAMDQRRATAAERVARWKAADNEPPVLRVAVPDGPGSRMVYDRVRQDLQAIGLNTRRVTEGAPADLRLVDVVARYGRATWFLNQLSCRVQRAVCSPGGDQRMAEARAALDPRLRAALLAEAEAEITSANSFIPIARPMRWSMVRTWVTGFGLSPWGWHPLPPLALLPR